MMCQGHASMRIIPQMAATKTTAIGHMPEAATHKKKQKHRK